MKTEKMEREMRVYSISVDAWTKIIAKNKDEAIGKLMDATGSLLESSQKSGVHFLSFTIEGITEEVFEFDGQDLAFKSEKCICPCCGEEDEE